MKEQDQISEVEITALSKLSKELRAAADTMTSNETRYLVDRYYQIQKERIATQGQIRALDQEADGGPAVHVLMDWLLENTFLLEKALPAVLARYARSLAVGRWLLSVHGIGPVLAAGLLAHIDIAVCPTVGHIWSFAGLNPDKKWEKKQKRPWNADLKTLCWKVGQSFLKSSNSEKSVYGKIYRERKAQEIEKNEAGEFAEQAAEKAKIVGEKTEAFKAYSVGKLPPAHLDARARRYAVKLFLAHLHGVWFRDHFGEAPPKPYAIAHLGHTHIIEPKSA